MNTEHTLTLQYFALFREQASKREESWTTRAHTPQELYDELKARYGFTLQPSQLKVAINNEFGDWQHALKNGDTVAFIPPVAGG